MTAASRMATPDLAGLLKPRAVPTHPAPAGDGDEGPPGADEATTSEAPTSVVPVQPPAPPVVTSSRHDDGPAPEADRPTSSDPTQGPDRPDRAGRSYRRLITVYLPRDLHRLIGAAATESATTRTAVMLEAVNRTHRRLGPALQLDREPGERELFAVPQARTTHEPSVQTTLRVTDEQYGALESLATQHAVNRSKIMAAAIRLHLDPADGPHV